MLIKAWESSIDLLVQLQKTKICLPFHLTAKFIAFKYFNISVVYGSIATLMHDVIIG